MQRQSRSRAFVRIWLAVAPPAPIGQTQSPPKRPFRPTAPYALTPGVGTHLSCLTGNAHHGRQDNEGVASRQRRITQVRGRAGWIQESHQVGAGTARPRQPCPGVHCSGTCPPPPPFLESTLPGGFAAWFGLCVSGGICLNAPEDEEPTGSNSPCDQRNPHCGCIEY
jgi:hypothetical protein